MPSSSPAMPFCTGILRSLKEVDWAGVVLDEAQNIKNPETKQAKAARAIQGRLPHCTHRHTG